VGQVDLEDLGRELERLSREAAETRMRQGELEETMRHELKTLGRQVSRLEERQRSLEERHDGLMHMLLDTQTQLGDQVEQALGRIRQLEKSWQQEEAFRAHVERTLDRHESDLDEQRAMSRTLEESLEQRHAEWQEQADANRIEQEAQLGERLSQLDSEWLIRQRDLRSEMDDTLAEVQAALASGIETLARRQGRTENDLVALTEHGAILTETIASFQHRIEEQLEGREKHLAQRLDDSLAQVNRVLGDLDRTQREHRQELLRLEETGTTQAAELKKGLESLREAEVALNASLQRALEAVRSSTREAMDAQRASQQRGLDTVREAGEARDANLYRELTRLREELEQAQRAWESEVPILQGRMKEVVQLLVKAGRLEVPAPAGRPSSSQAMPPAPPAQTPQPQAPPGQKRPSRRNP
jgi:chromosome segregation ATPase